MNDEAITRLQAYRHFYKRPRTINIQLRMPSEMHELLYSWARREGRPGPDLIRDILAERLIQELSK